jgi:CxxC motif-containing protein (DUF1111 family)
MESILWKAHPALPQYLALVIVGQALVVALPVDASGDTGLPSLGTTTQTLQDKWAFTHPIASLDVDHRRDFSFGNRLFKTNWVPSPSQVKSFDGLGPLFNQASCFACHVENGRGQPPTTKDQALTSMLVRLSVHDPKSLNGASPHPVYGEQINDHAISGFRPEAEVHVSYDTIGGSFGDGTAYQLLKPTYSVKDAVNGPLSHNTMISPRVAPQMIGLGLLEAYASDAMAASADPDDSNGDGISGRLNKLLNPVTNSFDIGRFGWKATEIDLKRQNAIAAFGDIGLTSSLHAEENCSPQKSECIATAKAPELDLSDKFLERLTLYTRLIAVPAQRNPGDILVKRGEALFTGFGCAACHLPTLKTDDTAPLPELTNQIFHPFTDLLLHDMGEGLADGRPDGEASGNEWRTPPLWGIGLIETVNGHNRLLHDGRARGAAEAILWHGGEATKSKEAFRNAPKAERDALLAFLKSL